MSVVSPCAVPSDRADLMPSTVREAMVTRPKTCDVTTTVAQARETFRDDHVHALLLVRRGRLVSVVQRRDLLGEAAAEKPAMQFGSLSDRVVVPDADLEDIYREMITRSQRRLAVVDVRHNLLGLLCLKRSLRGFCSDEDVQARTMSTCDA